MLLGSAGFATHELTDGVQSASTPQPRPPELIIISESITITRADGTKSLSQLIREQSTSTPTPDLQIKSFHFIVDAQHDALILDRNEGAQPEGFQIAIAPETDLKFNISKIPLNAPEALELFPVR